MFTATRFSLMMILATMIGISVQPTAFAQESKFGARIKIHELSIDCDDAAIGFLAPIATFFVEEGVGILKGLLEKRAQEYGASYAATAADQLVKQCGTPSSPSFLTRIKGIDFAYGELSGDYVTNPNVELTANIESFMEGNQSVFRIVPTKINFDRPVAKRGSEKDVVVSYTFDFPTAYNGKGKASGLKLSTVLPAFEGLEKGDGPIDIAGVSSDWFPVPQVSPNSKVVNNELALPFSVLISVTETDKGLGPKIFLELAKQINENKSKIVELVVGNEQEQQDENSE